ncbi:protein-(glutamine-N5) methyltransferase, release factor-specific [Caldalkalibacillus thermarum TA2.A1]|uniref:Release factor glutamine methyltransferase n=1 Tax=Caldalkalibacillus thermarum (strain TA2.A1) TaxID=986075 RepID=F5LA93_CALTT|nr:peptide chain release factor N(5)-glutamine methyltransferase [Caldalkalibacillus thermarum]EGL81813.1 protein-(glutamine-N5) methyltransferase, release factor-specific [Caldalkalibacillus thermarum TA2.A1]QZT34186.1 peptide chain release factor N(5)-glutamine methyltransferase [Caldalkalibacillus thermarum TA2.A1]
MDQPKTMRTCREALVWASSLLQQAGLNPKVAEWVLTHVLAAGRAEFLNMLDQPLPEEQKETFVAYLERILQGEPYQYVLGSAEFYGREFVVNRNVLIPRPETELLVEAVLKLWQSNWWERKNRGESRMASPGQPVRAGNQPLKGRPLKAVDVGTGSGAIAVTLALETAGGRQGEGNGGQGQPAQDGPMASPLEMLAVDISPAALKVAKINAERWQAKVELMHSNWLQALIETGHKVDVIVSNPPYVSLEERYVLDRTVVDYEPHLALFAGDGGLLGYKQIVRQSPAVLNRPGVLAFEVGRGQAEEVIAIIQAVYPEAQCSVIPDWQGIGRVVVAKIEA